jgi:hypothetical protein
MENKNRVADMLYNRKVVSDEEHGQSEFLLDVLQKVDDLGLNADIQGADRFIADKEFRFHGECASNPDPLSLTTAELMRET